MGRSSGGVEAEEAMVEASPELGSSGGDDDGDAVASEDDAGRGSEQVGAEAFSAEASLAMDVEELGSSGHEIGGEEEEEELDFVGSEAVVDLVGLAEHAAAVVALGTLGRRELGREGGVASSEVGLRRTSLAVALEQVLGALLLGGSAREEEEVVQKEMLLLVGSLDDDEHDPSGAAPGAGLIGELMEPGSAFGRWPTRGTTQEGLGESVERTVVADAADVGDPFGLERVEESGLGEAGIGPDPDALDERLEPVDDRKHEVEPAVGGMSVARPQPSAEEEASQNARHQRMVAAHPVVAVVGALGLMPMNLVGQRVQIDGDLAPRGEEGPDELAQDGAQPRAVLLARECGLQPRERRLRAEAVRLIPAGRPERTISPSLRDGEPEDRIVVKQRDIVLVPPALRHREKPRPNQLQERVLDSARVPRIAQVPCDEPWKPQLVAQLPQQQGTRIGRETLRSGLDANRTVEIQREQRTLQFTHGVFGGSVMKVRRRHPHLITAPADTPWVFYALQSAPSVTDE